jgi:nucleoside-diphosphate-sugar epimerase
VIPTIITQALSGPTIRLGALDTRRDLTFVTDTAEGFVAAATASGVEGSTIQLGTGTAPSVGEIVGLVGDILGREIAVEHDHARLRPAASEVRTLVSDPSRASGRCGWRPSIDLEEGLQRTVEWVERNRERFRVGEYVT